MASIGNADVNINENQNVKQTISEQIDNQKMGAQPQIGQIRPRSVLNATRCPERLLDAPAPAELLDIWSGMGARMAPDGRQWALGVQTWHPKSKNVCKKHPKMLSIGGQKASAFDVLGVKQCAEECLIHVFPKFYFKQTHV